MKVAEFLSPMTIDMFATMSISMTSIVLPTMKIVAKIMSIRVVVGAQHRALRMILSALGLNPDGFKTRHTGEVSNPL